MVERVTCFQKCTKFLSHVFSNTLSWRDLRLSHRCCWRIRPSGTWHCVIRFVVNMKTLQCFWNVGNHSYRPRNIPEDLNPCRINSRDPNVYISSHILVWHIFLDKKYCILRNSQLVWCKSQEMCATFRWAAIFFNFPSCCYSDKLSKSDLLTYAMVFAPEGTRRDRGYRRVNCTAP